MSVHLLMERGLKRKGHGVDGSISELDIREVFTELGGGTMYAFKDGRTVLEWWKHGSSTGVSQKISFDERLEKFNEKIKFKRENKVDSAKLFLTQYQRIAYDRFWNQASKEAGIYYHLSRLRERGLGKFLSIPDSDLMRKIFPEQKSLDDYL